MATPANDTFGFPTATFNSYLFFVVGAVVSVWSAMTLLLSPLRVGEIDGGGPNAPTYDIYLRYPYHLELQTDVVPGNAALKSGYTISLADTHPAGVVFPPDLRDGAETGCEARFWYVSYTWFGGILFAAILAAMNCCTTYGATYDDVESFCVCGTSSSFAWLHLILGVVLTTFAIGRAVSLVMLRDCYDDHADVRDDTSTPAALWAEFGIYMAAWLIYLVYEILFGCVPQFRKSYIGGGTPSATQERLL